MATSGRRASSRGAPEGTVGIDPRSDGLRDLRRMRSYCQIQPGKLTAPPLGLAPRPPDDGVRPVEQLDSVGFLVVTVRMARGTSTPRRPAPQESMASIESCPDPAGAVDDGMPCRIGYDGEVRLGRSVGHLRRARLIVGHVAISPAVRARQRPGARRPGGSDRTVGTYSSSWMLPSKVRLLVRSRATSG